LAEHTGRFTDQRVLVRGQVALRRQESLQESVAPDLDLVEVRRAPGVGGTVADVGDLEVPVPDQLALDRRDQL
jgi:hypothetical protein